MVARYIIFCILAIAVNIGVQYLSLSLYQGVFSLYVAMFLGTGSGLVCKFIMDKLYIFSDSSESISDDVKKFFLYTVMGLGTTAIFWLTEMAFHYLWDSEIAKYVGALIGLTIGYILKYFLDRKFVFINSKRSL